MPGDGVLEHTGWWVDTGGDSATATPTPPEDSATYPVDSGTQVGYPHETTGDKWPSFAVANDGLWHFEPTLVGPAW